MRVLPRGGSTLFFGAILALVLAPTAPNKPIAGKPQQLIITVRQTPKGLRFEVESVQHKKYEDKNKMEANYFLAEIKMNECGECQLIEIVDDRAPLSAITEVSEMAINAGFKDIRPFVYWHKTGGMAEVQFGPPIRFTRDSAKLEQRVSGTS